MPWNGMIAVMGESFAEPATEYGFSTSSVSLFGSDFDPFAATARLFIDADGGIRKYQEIAGNGTTSDVGTWSSAHPDEENGADYEVMIEYVSGSTYYTGFQTLGQYYALDSNRQYNFDRTSFGAASGTYRITIRDVATAGATFTDTLDITVQLEQGTP